VPPPAIGSCRPENLYPTPPGADFDATYRLLWEASPVFATAVNSSGLGAFSLDSGDEAPGPGLTDPGALFQFMSTSSQGLTNEESGPAPRGF